PSAIPTDLHPYSTYNFRNQTTHWSPVPRTQIHPGDALVYNENGAGHIVLFESGNDPWGNLWVYEARGCSWGIVHDARAFSASFITIRREGLLRPSRSRPDSDSGFTLFRLLRRPSHRCAVVWLHLNARSLLLRCAYAHV